MHEFRDGADVYVVISERCDALAHLLFSGEVTFSLHSNSIQPVIAIATQKFLLHIYKDKETHIDRFLYLHDKNTALSLVAIDVRA
jgi:hypothetical protein